MTVTLPEGTPGVCLCAHLRGGHEVDTKTGRRTGKCILAACGCGSYRPDPRGIAGREQDAARWSA